MKNRAETTKLKHFLYFFHHRQYLVSTVLNYECIICVSFDTNIAVNKYSDMTISRKVLTTFAC